MLPNAFVAFSYFADVVGQPCSQWLLCWAVDLRRFTLEELTTEGPYRKMNREFKIHYCLWRNTYYRNIQEAHTHTREMSQTKKACSVWIGWRICLLESPECLREGQTLLYVLKPIMCLIMKVFEILFVQKNCLPASMALLGVEWEGRVRMTPRLGGRFWQNYLWRSLWGTAEVVSSFLSEMHATRKVDGRFTKSLEARVWNP